MNNATESMRKMTASRDRMASVMVRKQELLEKQGKLASLWKLQVYHAIANQFEKMMSVMTQIEAMTDLLTQRNEEPDDEIMIDGDGKNDVELNHGDSENADNVYEESSDGQESVDNAEEEEEKEGEQTSGKANNSDSEEEERSNEQGKE